MHKRLAVCLLLLSTSTAISAEVPSQYLHCTFTDNLLPGPATHEVTVYAQSAMIDDEKYEVSVTDAFYVLSGPIKITADILNPRWKTVINRITGAYTTLGSGRAEQGSCESAKRKF